MKTKSEEKLKAYKVFNPDWTCKGFQYEVGKTYSIKDTPIMCESGFHACIKVSDCFTYYTFDPQNKVAEVELSGIVLGLDSDKQCAQKITIIKKISWESMLVLANSGRGNSGYSNSGSWNSGDRNSGYSNSGSSNSGDRNSGDRNSGDSNSGNSNSGYSNSGSWNSGYSNSGSWNSGDSNSGDSNSGNSNSGNSNSGYRNSGSWNSGSWNSGYFNSDNPTVIRVFGKDCDVKIWEKAIKPTFIFNIPLNTWINWDSMTDQEKKDNGKAFITNGYLKKLGYKEAWKVAYDSASSKDIEYLKALPNFDATIFKEITGIKVK
jgi:hypothetical protein